MIIKSKRSMIQKTLEVWVFVHTNVDRPFFWIEICNTGWADVTLQTLSGHFALGIWCAFGETGSTAYLTMTSLVWVLSQWPYWNPSLWTPCPSTCFLWAAKTCSPKLYGQYLAVMWAWHCLGLFPGTCAIIVISKCFIDKNIATQNCMFHIILHSIPFSIVRWTLHSLSCAEIWNSKPATWDCLAETPWHTKTQRLPLRPQIWLEHQHHKNLWIK